MSLMGWSSGSMAARYQHVTDALRSEVASQVGELIWTPAADARKDRRRVRESPSHLDFGKRDVASGGASARRPEPGPRHRRIAGGVPQRRQLPRPQALVWLSASIRALPPLFMR